MSVCADQTKEVFIWRSRLQHQGESYFNVKFSQACDANVQGLVADWNANETKATKK